MAVFLAHQVPVPLWIAVIENRNHINIETRATKRNGHTIGLGLDLVRTEVRKSFPEPLGEIVEQLSYFMRSIGATDVAGHINVVERSKRSTLSAHDIDV